MHHGGSVGRPEHTHGGGRGRQGKGKEENEGSEMREVVYMRRGEECAVQQSRQRGQHPSPAVRNAVVTTVMV